MAHMKSYCSDTVQMLIRQSSASLQSMPWNRLEAEYTEQGNLKPLIPFQSPQPPSSLQYRHQKVLRF